MTVQTQMSVSESIKCLRVFIALMIAWLELDAVLCIWILQAEHWLKPVRIGVKPFFAALSLVRITAGFAY